MPHLPSLDIRDGALDFLFNVYKRILPTLGDYITDHGGNVNLSHVDVILAEVGSIEDYVFSMKHQNEESEKKRKEQYKKRKQHLTKDGAAPAAYHPGGDVLEDDKPKKRGRAARILEQNEKKNVVALGREDSNGGNVTTANHKSTEENARAAEELKKSLLKGKSGEKSETSSPGKRKAEDISNDIEEEDDLNSNSKEIDKSSDSEMVDDTETDANEDDEEPDQETLDASTKVLKEVMKTAEQKKLNDYAENVVDNVRLHEKGWKVCDAIETLYSLFTIYFILY